MEKALQALNVSYSYDSSDTVIEDINLCIQDNEFTAIIGRNGSGKTTLLNNFTGLLRPSAGEIFIRGKNSRLMSVPEISAEIGFVMQNPDRQLFCDTVFDELAFALKRAKIPAGEIERRVLDALSACDLLYAKDSFPPALSRGERAKTVIASVLAMGPKIIILDEPAGGQDFHSIRMIMDIAAALQRSGHTIIFVTHNMAIAAQYAKRIIVMENKRIVVDGPPHDVFCNTKEFSPVRPPQITRLSMELQGKLALPRPALNVPELGEMLLEGDL